MSDAEKCIGKNDAESSWCRTCLSRNKCKDKDQAALEEAMLPPTKILKITSVCSRYIKDAKAKVKKSALERLFGL